MCFYIKLCAFNVNSSVLNPHIKIYFNTILFNSKVYLINRSYSLDIYPIIFIIIVTFLMILHYWTFYNFHIGNLTIISQRRFKTSLFSLGSSKGNFVSSFGDGGQYWLVQRIHVQYFYTYTMYKILVYIYLLIKLQYSIKFHSLMPFLL